MGRDTDELEKDSKMVSNDIKLYFVSTSKLRIANTKMKYMVGASYLYCLY